MKKTFFVTSTTLFLVVSLLASGCRPGVGTMPNEEGRIAFNSAFIRVPNPKSDYHQKIFLINSDGTNQRNIVDLGPWDSSNPTWSPDGTKIAFVSNRPANYLYNYLDSGPGGIYVMNVNSGNPVILTAGGYPAWSPDGTRIAFASSTDGHTQIYVINSDGTNRIKITNTDFDVWSPTWSPDGRKIAFSGRGDKWGIYVMNSDGSNQTRLTEHWSDGRPAWSPDGTRIAFDANRIGNDETYEIYVMNEDGTNLTRLTDTSFRSQSPAWSPDGTKIAFDSTRDGKYEIYVMNADGSNQTRITNTKVFDSVNPSWKPIP
jgi:Tol biopolymer transport system component